MGSCDAQETAALQMDQWQNARGLEPAVQASGAPAEMWGKALRAGESALRLKNDDEKDCTSFSHSGLGGLPWCQALFRKAQALEGRLPQMCKELPTSGGLSERYWPDGRGLEPLCFAAFRRSDLAVNALVLSLLPFSDLPSEPQTPTPNRPSPSLQSALCLQVFGRVTARPGLAGSRLQRTRKLRTHFGDQLRDFARAVRRRTITKSQAEQLLEDSRSSDPGIVTSWNIPAEKVKLQGAAGSVQ